MFIKQTGSVLALAFALILSCTLAQESRQNPGGKKQQSQVAGTKQRGNDTCGSSDDLALKVEVCAKPLMDILEGKVEKYPQNDNDLLLLCNSFLQSERCIRDLGRRCAKGVQKTIISTLANSVQRARKRECIKPKYPGILKTTTCIEKHQDLVQNLISNATRHLDVVEHQMKNLDRKTTAVCCMVHDVENEIGVLLKPRCPEGSAFAIRLYRAVLEDVLELICRSPKCEDTFKGYKIPRTNIDGGIVAILLRVVFSLG